MEAVEALVDKGADMEAGAGSGRSALHIALDNFHKRRRLNAFHQRFSGWTKNK